MNRLLISLVCLLGTTHILFSQCYCDDAFDTCVSLDVPFDCSNCAAICNFFAGGAPVRSCPGLGSCILPVKFTAFSAQVLEKSNQIRIEWSTASEVNNEGFEIQRSIDGDSWKSQSFIKGNGTTTKPQYYMFLDFPSIAGTYYYRLKQVDYDGNFEYSNILAIKYSIEIAVTNIFPNPVKDILFIRTDYSQVMIYDRYGKLQKTMSINGQQSQINLGDFKPGTYFIHFKEKNNKDLTRKILKL